MARSLACLAARAAACLAACFLAIAMSAIAAAEDNPHSAPGRRPQAGMTDISQLTAPQKRDALVAFRSVICACPKEKWSRTLEGCPDDCAETQKSMVVQRIAEGWTLDRILDEQVATYGQKATADPGASRDGSYWIIGGLFVGAIAAASVIASWLKRSAARAAALAAVPQASQPALASDAEASAIERELREVD